MTYIFDYPLQFELMKDFQGGDHYQCLDEHASRNL